MGASKQKEFEGISDPGNYRLLSEPVSPSEAESRMKAFYDEFYELRNKHKIADAYVIVKVNVKCDEGEGPMLSCMHCGSELESESMASWAVGFEQSQRKTRILRLMEQAGKVAFRELKK